MSLSVDALAAQGQTLIDEVGCVNKSFPGFFDYLKKVKAGQ
jgi:5-enolpyruvylshikimate-3-phosphate synthase